MTSPGHPVEVRMSKWGDRPHWTFAGAFLGTDDHGSWVGWPAGTRHTRPGAEFVAPIDAVTLLPGDPALWWLATFYAPGFRVDTYVDVATPPTWDDAPDPPAPLVARSTDLDLDVVRLPDGTLYVDDEDEFDDHRVRLGYPDHVVDAARAACRDVRASVERGEPPFDGTAARWLAVLDTLPRSHRPD